MTRILACLDRSVYARSVCDQAAWAAARLSAAVELLHVLDSRDEPGPAAEAGEAAGGATDAPASDLLSEAAARLQGNGVAEVSQSLRHGTFEDALEEVEAAADLVVMGKRGEAADFAYLHLGANAARAARNSRKPLLICARAFRPIGRILIAFDGGAAADRVLDFVAESPLFAGLPCEIMMVAESSRHEETALEAAAARLRDSGFDVETALRRGDADETIVARLDQGDIDMLVMGTSRHSRLRTLITGSTTMSVISSCRIPALLVR